ncbi:MAG: glycosyltransferase [Actinomycetales bacterium]|nr:glycosyltransferase [Actinomycetales bacterium]
MKLLLWFSVGCSWSLAVLALVNIRTMIRPKTGSPAQVLAEVEILIPARNEELVITNCVTSALAQNALPSLKVTVLDDGSTDQTLAALNAITDSRLQVISGSEQLPEGWLGKPWACARLAQQSTAQYLVFVDADVVLEADAVAHAIEMLNRENLSLVSPYPKQLAKTPLARLIQPLLQWSWLSTVPLPIAKRTSRKSLAVANGQFLVCRRAEYELAGGHGANPNAVLDDIMLLRAFYSAGLTGTVADGTSLATCFMYQSDRSLVTGYAKSLWSAFNGPIGSLVTNLFLLMTYTVPLIALASSQWPLAVLALVGAIYGRWIVAIRTKQSLPAVVTHSVAIFAFAYLNLYSWFAHLRGLNTWKGRSV